MAFSLGLNRYCLLGLDRYEEYPTFFTILRPVNTNGTALHRAGGRQNSDSIMVCAMFHKASVV